MLLYTKKHTASAATAKWRRKINRETLFVYFLEFREESEI
jgi:hypothetical protein